MDVHLRLFRVCRGFVIGQTPLKQSCQLSVGLTISEIDSELEQGRRRLKP
jgi:hypothetical protein